ncbi:hypothetical protein JX266_005583 [Neoarthrinium moseri]|uniref:uncharacterized protein n=1 Tax=Neoarthrinium moseri TaxID=1658444 RepID=UPI001FDD4B4B|nr:uncharacterized protein JN550_008389 [Neoarthrinium moseri]KAI1848724.1 hypothetical protein JX266_005583 [Neoarthrinium moseri]KAI1865341.1 hypothetical protein JN550_008389 [Neoarthrinium moseri]
MKASSILGGLALAGTSVADSTLASPPSKVQRDITAVSSAVAQVSAAMVTLDTSVKAFDTDATQVKSDSAALIETIKSAATTLDGSSDLSLTDAVSLQSSVSSLGTVGKSLISDLEAKKSQFEKAGLCSDVQSSFTDISTTSNSLIETIIGKLPEEAQSIAKGLVGDVQDTLQKGADAFSSSNCKSSGGSSALITASATATGAKATSEVAATGGGGGAGAVTVTVTAPCQCAGSSTTRTTAASIPSSFPVSSFPVTSVRANSTIPGTGTLVRPSSTTASAIVTAGASANGIGPVGLVAGLFAALVL